MPVAYRKVIICLANSRKISGRCVAGKEVNEQGVGGWVRPVSERENGELSEADRRFEDGADPKLLDVISIPMKRPNPHEFQVENHVIDDGYYWKRIRTATADEVAAAIDHVNGPLWDNQSSSYNGQHDRVSEAQANQLGYSLCLIPVDDLQVHIGVEGAEFGNGKRRVRGLFTFNGAQYLLSITDSVVERRYLAGKDGTFDLGAATLSISLGEPWQGYAYKLIAAVLP
ncbi:MULTISPECIES: hypothetical protein [unclassified Mesorhizobium]|uniref:dual OB domain-containing protein n=1 Tax=unclassified Mesorhizobium TaxID=325217 RepID=UPI003338C318